MDPTHGPKRSPAPQSEPAARPRLFDYLLWSVGKGTGSLPDFLTDDDFKKYVVLGYILFMVSMGTLAVVIWLFSLITRWPRPWTHTLGLALMIWPAAPLLVVWIGNIKME